MFEELDDPHLKNLERKAKKAIRYKNNIWTDEEIVYARAKAKIWANIFFVNNSRDRFITLLNKIIRQKQRE